MIMFFLFMFILLFIFIFFFFFQAEDGIRDGHVTGVQTCALPISNDSARRAGFFPIYRDSGIIQFISNTAYYEGGAIYQNWYRSEERRVGKECRSRWWPEH